jgi:uncharacterized protein
MRIAVTGSRGLLGSALVPELTAAGHEVVRLVRGPAGAGELPWDPSRPLDAAALEGCDAVVHLAGENVSDGRWSAAKKRRIRESRVLGTRTLCAALAASKRPPDVLLSASAVGYYGDRGDALLDEASEPGRGFLAEVCQEWEAACAPAAARGVRVVCLRTGVVLTPKGGALRKLLTPFRLGGGGPIGSGRQWMSWIALDDVLGALRHALLTPSLRGPANLVAPGPVPNAEFARTLGRVLRRPALLPLPAFAVKAALGEMGEALLLASARAQPAQLLRSGYAFRLPDLEGALRHLLGR